MPRRRSEAQVKEEVKRLLEEIELLGSKQSAEGSHSRA
jgi:hypothetical protein